MTTAARPTFDTARGGQGARERDLSALSKQYSSRDLPSHQTLKTRERGQSSVDEVAQRDLKRDLHEREAKAARDKRGDKMVAVDRRGQIEGPQAAKKSRPSSEAQSAALDADDPVEESGSDDSDSSDDDDDTAALMAELNKIKREKAQEEAEREEERRAEEEKIRMENILTGNPLTRDKYAPAAGADGKDLKVKRRWDDDVVFKNCSRAQPDKAEEKTFINDSLRSEFHKKFMDKYIK